MKTKDLIELYEADAFVQTAAGLIGQSPGAHLQLEGLKGSQDVPVAATISRLSKTAPLIVLNNREEAEYFRADLETLTGNEILFFPSSFKRPYKFEETDNANIVQRAEVLNRLNENPDMPVITYPEALTERVINKQTLVDNTFRISKGEKIGTEFLSETLLAYGFEMADFVYEPGQFAIRGGIVDIFSFSNDEPFRIEFFGDEIESLRTFDPDSQLSVAHKNSISITPNIHTRLHKETRESFFDFFGNNRVLWIKNKGHLLEIIRTSYSKAVKYFDETTAGGKAGPNLAGRPEELFEQEKEFEEKINRLGQVEFGTKFFNTGAKKLEFEAENQPNFNKDFKSLTEFLKIKKAEGYRCILSSDTHKQLDRLETVISEHDSNLNISYLNAGLGAGFTDHRLKLVCFTDHQIFERFHRAKHKEKAGRSKSITLRELQSLSPGDYVTHSDHGIARFAGLEKVENSGRAQEGIRLIFKDNDMMLVSIHALHKISKYSGKEGETPQITKLGSGDWESKKKRAKSKVKDIAKELISLYAKRKTAHGYAFRPDNYMQTELESSFFYEDTPDQAKSTAAVKEDMEKPAPMDRLVCGDVGFGKTEIAVRAAFKAVCDSKQVALLVPTTILAFQHFKTFKERLKNFPCRVDYVSRFRTAKEISKIKSDLKEGKIDILIGTHKIAGKEMEFKDLGLLIIDEEQKFGVKVKEKLKEIKVNVDTLTLTATPIPRTLQFSLMGARDLSVIATPPPNRRPVRTEVAVFNEEVIRDAISNELSRGGQVFFVHNRISDIESMADTIYRLVPEARIAYAHGQMEGSKLENIMLSFIEGEYDVLISTNIIESGLDIPNANTIIINRANMFGLSDLHQMRGRVGRSNIQAYCYLLTQPLQNLPADARKRLQTLEEFSDLGDGIKVAMRDLDIRGAGNLLGGEQSGFITDLGFEMYHQILDEAITELKETEFKELFKNEIQARAFVNDCVMETDEAVLIPEYYINNISERLRVYTDLDNFKKEDELDNYLIQLKDRFGPLPTELQNLSKTVRLRQKAIHLGFEKVIFKNRILKCYFSNKQEYFKSEAFGNILEYLKSNPDKAKLKDEKNQALLIFEKINSIDESLQVINTLRDAEVNK